MGAVDTKGKKARHYMVIVDEDGRDYDNVAYIDFDTINARKKELNSAQSRNGGKYYTIAIRKFG